MSKMTEKEERKLSAIMFTDMVSYSSLAQENEILALELLEEHRKILRTFFPKYSGREVETAGDAFFAEFSSALEAVNCAIEIQKGLWERNKNLPNEKHIKIRIGIHLGDVVHRGNNVLGDGVTSIGIQPILPALLPVCDSNVAAAVVLSGRGTDVVIIQRYCLQRAAREKQRLVFQLTQVYTLCLDEPLLGELGLMLILRKLAHFTVGLHYEDSLGANRGQE